MNHTPGPWKAIKGNDMWPDAGWGVIAVDPMRGRVDSQIAGMKEEDARLCASAPDMLKALERISLIGGDLPDDRLRGMMHCEARRIALSALGKTTENQGENQ